MISFKLFSENVLIPEAFPLKYAKKKKMSRKYSGAYNDRLNQIFGGEDRLIYPLELNYNEQTNHKLLDNINNLLFKNGYSISSLADYIKGIAHKTNSNGADYKNPVRIGKLLEKFEPVDEIEITTRENGRRERKRVPGKPLLHEYKMDPMRKGAGQYYVVVSRHPYDISGASTDRNWTSCMDLGSPRVEYKNKSRNEGMNKKFIPRDIQQGSIISYVVTKDELLPNGKVALRRPLSRILLKPHKSDKSPVYTVGKMYGNPYEEFAEFMTKWTTVNLNNEIAEGDRVYKNKQLYADEDRTVGFDFTSGSKPADQAMDGIVGIRNEKEIGNHIEYTSSDNGQSVNYEMYFLYEFKPGFVPKLEDIDEIRGNWAVNNSIPSEFEREISSIILKNFGVNHGYYTMSAHSVNDGKDLVIKYTIHLTYNEDDKHHIEDDELIEMIEERLPGLSRYDYSSTKRQLEQAIRLRDVSDIESKREKYIQDGVDQVMSSFNNHTAFNNPRYVKSQLHNLTPITVPEYMKLSPVDKEAYNQFLRLCGYDLQALNYLKESEWSKLDSRLKNKSEFIERVNNTIYEWIKLKYGLDLVDFKDKRDIDWSIFKLRPYWEDDDAAQMSEAAEELTTITRYAKYLTGNRTNRTDQI